MSEPELKSCAHCGNTCVVIKQSNMHPFDESYYAQCTDSECYMHTGYCNNREHAIEIWNKRV